MSFVPFEDFYILSQLNPIEAEERLQKEIDPSQTFSLKNVFSRQSSSCYFSGYIFHDTFVIKPIINYRNSFLPEVKGKIESYGEGCRVHIKMAMDQGVFIFMCIWMSMAFLFGIGFIYQIYKEGEFSFIIFAPIIMMCFGYVLATGGFKFESSDTKNKLLTILEGETE